MRRAALLLFGLPIACAPDAPSANGGEIVAASNVAAAPITPAQNESPAAPDLPPAQPPVPRGTSSPPATPEQADAENYRAIGTEPFWAVTVRDDLLLLERPDRPPLRIAVTRGEAQARSIRYAGDGFTMTVTPGPCSDGMSAIWSDRVQIAFADGTLKGCGGNRDKAE